MAIGIDVFREHFRNYSDQYVLIGGVASAKTPSGCIPIIPVDQ